MGGFAGLTAGQPALSFFLEHIRTVNSFSLFHKFELHICKKRIGGNAYTLVSPVEEQAENFDNTKSVQRLGHSLWTL